MAYVENVRRESERKKKKKKRNGKRNNGAHFDFAFKCESDESISFKLLIANGFYVIMSLDLSASKDKKLTYHLATALKHDQNKVAGQKSSHLPKRRPHTQTQHAHQHAHKH